MNNYKIINIILVSEYPKYHLVKCFFLVKIRSIPIKPGSEDIWVWEYQFCCLRGNIKKIVNPSVFEKLWDSGSKVAIAYKKLGYKSELDDEQLIWTIKTNFRTMCDLSMFDSIHTSGCINIKK